MPRRPILRCLLLAAFGAAGVAAAADLSVTKVDAADPVAAGANITYTITVTNSGPDAAATVEWSDQLPAGTTFVSLSTVAGWTCVTPAEGSDGIVSCSIPSLPVGSTPFTLTVRVNPAVQAGSMLPNRAIVMSANETNPGNESATATTTVTTPGAIPTLDQIGLMLLALLLAVGGAWKLRHL